MLRTLSVLTGTLLLAAGLLTFLVPGCSSREPERPNVLWIVVDTMRADRLGGEWGLTPYMDRLGERGVVFEKAYAQAPWTLPSIGSMMTSLHPKEHGAGGRLGQFQSVREGVPTAPKVFAQAGYTTHAIVNVEFLKKKYGVTRDFEQVDVESYSNNQEVRNAARTTDAALRYMQQERDGQPFFLLVHYFDMHAVYDPPQPFRRRYAAPPDQEAGPNRTMFGTREHLMALRAGQLELNPEWIDRAERLYNGEVAYTDAEIGRLLDQVAAMGFADNTLIVLCGDHGEEFLDHGGFEHGHTVYDELIHVPLIMAGPGVRAGTRVPHTVRMIDVLPTLCQWADVGAERGFVGRSLMPELQGEAGADRNVLAHGNMWGAPFTAWREGPWKLILSENAQPELYRMDEDPGEQNNLSAQESERLQALQGTLQSMEKTMAALGRGANVELSEAELEALKASGYGGGD